MNKMPKKLIVILIVLVIIIFLYFSYNPDKIDNVSRPSLDRDAPIVTDTLSVIINQVTINVLAEDISGISEIEIRVKRGRGISFKDTEVVESCKNIDSCSHIKIYPPGTYTYYIKAKDNSPSKNEFISEAKFFGAIQPS